MWSSSTLCDGTPGGATSLDALFYVRHLDDGSLAQSSAPRSPSEGSTGSTSPAGGRRSADDECSSSTSGEVFGFAAPSVRSPWNSGSSFTAPRLDFLSFAVVRREEAR